MQHFSSLSRAAHISVSPQQVWGSRRARIRPAMAAKPASASAESKRTDLRTTDKKCCEWSVKHDLLPHQFCSRELCVLSFYNMMWWNLTEVAPFMTRSVTLITDQNMWIFQKCDNVSGTAEIKSNFMIEIYGVFAILLCAPGHAVHTVFYLLQAVIARMHEEICCETESGPVLLSLF